MRDHDVRSLSAGELERARRELSASLALTRPDSPMRVPTQTHISAIDAELAGRASTALRYCGCGYGTDSATRMEGHLWDYPGHAERDMSRYLP